MAELLGVVASGISIATLAAQIGSSVIKLKGYWKDLKEAPEDIRLLIEEIEDIQLVLSEIEEDQRHNPISSTASGSTSASRCLERCKVGADLLKSLADELGAEITSSSKRKKAWASAKVILKKDKVEKYKLQLERAVRVLTLSYQSYTNALVRLQPDIIISRLTHSTTYLQHSDSLVTTTETIRQDQPLTSCQSLVASSISRRTKKPSSATKDENLAVQHERVQLSAPILRLRFQAWLINQAWNIELLSARSGWTFNFRIRNVISFDSPTFSAVSSGNVSMLQELFHSGQASLFDMFSFSHHYTTLIDVAILKANPEMCKFLLEQGVCIDEEEEYSSIWPSKYHHIAANVFVANGKAESIIAILLMLRKYYRFDREYLLSILHSFRGPDEIFELFKQFSDIPYQKLPLEARVGVACRMAHGAFFNSPKIFELALDEHPIPAEAITMQVPGYGTLLCSVATAFGGIMKRQSNTWYDRRDHTDLPSWRAILRELVTGGADLHAVSHMWLDGKSEVSPFLCVLLGLAAEPFGLEDARDVAPTMSLWLEALVFCGVDLLEYGRKEKEWQQGASAIKFFRMYSSCEYDGHSHEWRLIGFDYGSSPSDWHIYMSDPTTEFAGDFWRLIESPEFIMPGSWLDWEESVYEC